MDILAKLFLATFLVIVGSVFGLIIGSLVVGVFKMALDGIIKGKDNE